MLFSGTKGRHRRETKTARIASLASLAGAAVPMMGPGSAQAASDDTAENAGQGTGTLVEIADAEGVGNDGRERHDRAQDTLDEATSSSLVGSPT
ncbi:hypothetical protein [Streptomyces sp. KR80]|uniref:hypothetical protein n=1 Tax=Streptomyces sp. KR80 TaxID=3457426 RepID=UPI003FD17A0E